MPTLLVLVHKSTVSRILHRFIDAVNEFILPTAVTSPRDPIECKAIISGFRKVGGLLNVCGCVDGKHINIIAPKKNEEQFVNKHGNHSINSMLVCGPNLKIFYVSSKWPGSVSDARVYRNSTLCA